MTYHNIVYCLFLKTMLNMKQTIAKMIPIVASKKKITVNAMDTVTVSSIGTPSYGLPSSFYKEQLQIGACKDVCTY